MLVSYLPLLTDGLPKGSWFARAGYVLWYLQAWQGHQPRPPPATGPPPPAMNPLPPAPAGHAQYGAPPGAWAGHPQHQAGAPLHWNGLHPGQQPPGAGQPSPWFGQPRPPPSIPLPAPPPGNPGLGMLVLCRVCFICTLLRYVQAVSWGVLVGPLISSRVSGMYRNAGWPSCAASSVRSSPTCSASCTISCPRHGKHPERAPRNRGQHCAAPST